MAKKTLLKRAEAAEHLGIAIRTLDALTAQGDLPVVHIGHAVRYKERSLDEYIDAHEARRRGPVKKSRAVKIAPAGRPLLPQA